MSLRSFAVSAAAVGAGLGVVVGLLGGCGGGVRPELGVVYPEAMGQVEVLDVQVVRDGVFVEIANTTARPIGAGRYWVNRSYSLPMDGMGVGERVRLDLRAFRNRFGEPFRAGGFFATRTPKDVVLVQVEEEGVDGLLGLVVVRGEAER